jgi:hypothetical protein
VIFSFILVQFPFVATRQHQILLNLACAYCFTEEKKISFAPAPGVYKVLCKGGSRRHIAAAVAVALAALITSLRGEEVG